MNCENDSQRNVLRGVCIVIQWEGGLPQHTRAVSHSYLSESPERMGNKVPPPSCKDHMLRFVLNIQPREPRQPTRRPLTTSPLRAYCTTAPSGSHHTRLGRAHAHKMSSHVSQKGKILLP